MAALVSFSCDSFFVNDLIESMAREAPEFRSFVKKFLG